MNFIRLLPGILFLLAIESTAQSVGRPRSLLRTGSSIEEYPKVDWLQGEPVGKLDSSKTYIIELWATWCLPCIAVMPHMSELNEKFKDKGIVFVAQNVMEDNKEAVVSFYRKRPKVLNYRVSFGGGDDSEISRQWLKPAGIASIPQTMVIQGNKLVWLTHPAKLNDKVLELLLNGKFTVEAAEGLQ